MGLRWRFRGKEGAGTGEWDGGFRTFRWLYRRRRGCEMSGRNGKGFTVHVEGVLRCGVLVTTYGCGPIAMTVSGTNDNWAVSGG